MTRWALLRQAARPLLPWLLLGLVAVFGAGAGAGAYVAAGMAQGKIERAEKACVSDKLAEKNAEIRFLNSENERLDRLAKRQASRARALQLMLRDLSVRAAKEREELEHALAETDLRSCDARKPARLLRAKAERYRRLIARTGAHAGHADGAGRARAGDAPQGQ